MLDKELLFNNSSVSVRARELLIISFSVWCMACPERWDSVPHLTLTLYTSLGKAVIYENFNLFSINRRLPINNSEEFLALSKNHPKLPLTHDPIVCFVGQSSDSEGMKKNLPSNGRKEIDKCSLLFHPIISCTYPNQSTALFVSLRTFLLPTAITYRFLFYSTKLPLILHF